MDNKKEERQTFESNKDHIDTCYSGNNIIREKVELYYDFLLSLLILIDETYLGSDIIKTIEDKINHFTWCFNKVSDNFEHERIHFVVKGSHYEYLWALFYANYYLNKLNEKDDKMELLTVRLKQLFTYNNIKSPNELYIFINLYKIFDLNLKKIY